MRYSQIIVDGSSRLLEHVSLFLAVANTSFATCSRHAVMAILDWLVRCIPGLSILCLLIIAECALQVVQTGLTGLRYPPGLVTSRNPVLAQIIFCIYSLILHILAFLFPIRLCRSVWQASKAIDDVRNARPGSDGSGKVKLEDAPSFNNASATAEQQDEAKTSNEPIMAIMLPSYKEDIGVLEDTLNVLSSHPLAPRSYDVSSTTSGPLTAEFCLL